MYDAQFGSKSCRKYCVSVAILLLLGLAKPSSTSAQSPSPAAAPTDPIDGATGVIVSPTLKWTGSCSATTVCEVQIGTDKTKLKSGASKLTTATWMASGLLANTTYYWQVITSNADLTGKPTPGPVWSFTTAAAQSGDNTNQLKTLGFGVGMALRWNILKPDLVSDAIVDANGFVRVNTRDNAAAGFMFEMHHFFLKNAAQTFGFGPFIAAQPGTDQILTSVGAGVMVGWKTGASGTSGFGLGVGYSATPASKILGAEFAENQKAPIGSDGKPLPIRLETVDRGEILFMASFVF